MIVFSNSKFKIQNDKQARVVSNCSRLLFFGSDGNYRNYGSYGNVAIKRGQRLLADYAEREQQKDCEAGLI